LPILSSRDHDQITQAEQYLSKPPTPDGAIADYVRINLDNGGAIFKVVAPLTDVVLSSQELANIEQARLELEGKQFHSLSGGV